MDVVTSNRCALHIITYSVFSDSLVPSTDLLSNNKSSNLNNHIGHLSRGVSPEIASLTAVNTDVSYVATAKTSLGVFVFHSVNIVLVAFFTPPIMKL